MIGAIVELERQDGNIIKVVNHSADDYRINQMRERGFMNSGEICGRLGIPLIGGELTQLRLVAAYKVVRVEGKS